MAEPDSRTLSLVEHCRSAAPSGLAERIGRGAERQLHHGLPALAIHEVDPHRGQASRARRQHGHVLSLRAQHFRLPQQAVSDHLPLPALPPQVRQERMIGLGAGRRREEVDVPHVRCRSPRSSRALASAARLFVASLLSSVASPARSRSMPSGRWASRARKCQDTPGARHMARRSTWSIVAPTRTHVRIDKASIADDHVGHHAVLTCRVRSARPRGELIARHWTPLRFPSSFEKSSGTPQKLPPERVSAFTP